MGSCVGCKRRMTSCLKSLLIFLSDDGSDGLSLIHCESNVRVVVIVLRFARMSSQASLMILT
jgi:hypothetical protein